MAKHITDRGAKKLDRTATKINGPADSVPGPSTNPATNVLLTDILLRSVGRIARQTVEKGVLSRSYDSAAAKKIVENRSMIHSLAAYGVTKVATRSVPGALLVGGGLLAKTLFDRSQSKRAARRAGHEALMDDADEE